MNKLRITTGELARICGVSQGTVDRALNGRTGIKQETRERILRIASQYGFRNVPGNTKEVGGKSRQIGVIVFNLNNEYFCKLITEIEAACRKLGYVTLVMFTNYDRQLEIESIRQLYGMGVDGIILCPVNFGQEFANYLRSFDIPIVTVGNEVELIPYVGVDDFAAMKFATERMIQEGFRKLIYFSPAVRYEDAPAQKRRLEGFLAAGGTEILRTVLTDIDQIEEEYDKETVIICSNDYYAIKVYYKTNGVSIVGFDDIDMLREHHIQISSVTYSIHEIASEAVKGIVSGHCKRRVVDHDLVRICP